MTRRIGLFGGSFDPIHHGHLIVARFVAERADLERIVLLPAARPPHKEAERLLDPTHRAEMIRLAVEGDELFELSDYDLRREGPSYTIDTVDHFQKTAGEETEVCWIIGADSLPELPAWHRAGELVERCRILTAARRGGVPIDWSKLGETFTPAQVARLKAGVLQTPVIEISSTDIRRRIAGGRSIRNLVPEAVRTYIKRHGLYRCETPSA